MPARTVLLCEDEDELRTELAELLEAGGYAVAQAADLAAALAALERQVYRAVITDLALPDGCGLDLLRSCRPPTGDGHADLRILITGHGGIERVERESSNHFDALLVKPFDARILLALLQGNNGAS